MFNIAYFCNIVCLELLNIPVRETYSNRKFKALTEVINKLMQKGAQTTPKCVFRI